MAALVVKFLFRLGDRRLRSKRINLDSTFQQHNRCAMTWQVAFHDEFVPEFRNLPPKVQDEVYAVGRMLERFGSQLGRPQVDTLNGSRHANMKEIRFRALGGE